MTSIALLAVGSGALIGLVLGLIGGGGSILAVPLLVYAVGESSPHVAIGTAACAVAVNAAVSLGLHARRAPIRWPCALVFSAAGIGGALAGAALGKMVDGQKLLALFGLLMIRELRTFGLVPADPMTLRAGFGRYALHVATGIVENYSKWVDTTKTTTVTRHESGQTSTSVSYRSVTHEAFTLRWNGGEHSVHVLDAATGHERRHLVQLARAGSDR